MNFTYNKICILTLGLSTQGGPLGMGKDGFTIFFSFFIGPILNLVVANDRFKDSPEDF